MNREDDNQLWDLLGNARKPRLSAFFSRNVLRQVKQEPELLRSASSWLNWKILAPASLVAAAVIIAGAVFMRTAPDSSHAPVKEKVVAATPPEPVKEKIEKIVTIAPVSKPPRVEAKKEAPINQAEPAKVADPATDDIGVVAAIDEQDYDTVANLDDLLVLYETSLWDENTSL